jgi:hypothetical protein
MPLLSIPSTDNALESTNKWIKDCETLRNRLSLSEFNNVAMQCVGNWSKDRNTNEENCDKPFILETVLSTKLYTLAFQWASSNYKMLAFKPVNNFQDYYFVELDHENRNSTGWNNDKLFILIKNGAEPIFRNNNKITIITPSYRINNLLEIKKSINFDYVDEWIIVYDGSKIINNPKLFEDDKIKEYVYKCNYKGISGNPQRNFALDNITNPDTLLYFLDDDNIIHPNLYRLLNIIDNTKMYSFNQYNRIKGNNICVNKIDTAMVLIPYKSCENIKWILNLYNADGYYIQECYNKNKKKLIYVNNDLCYYNKISI